MRRATMRLAWPAALLIIGACSPAALPVSWSIGFQAPALASRTVHLEVSLHDGTDCTGATRYAVSVRHGMETMRAPPVVPAGMYTMCADAVDDTCTIFAAGRTTFDLTPATANVAVLVVPTPASSACAGSACSHGECVVPDGSMPMDGDTPDAGGPIDAFVEDMQDAGPVTMPDAGCPTYFVTPPSAAACQLSTSDCLNMCTSQPCADACVAADPFPVDCERCLDDAFDSCINSGGGGCQTQWDAAKCCSAGCPDPDAATCCPPEWSAWTACAMAQGTRCDFVYDVCYP